MTTESQGPHWLTRLVLSVPNVIFAGWLATKMWPWFFPGHITIAQFVGVDMGWSMVTGVGLAMRISAMKKQMVRISADDRALLELAAEHKGMTLSAFVIAAAKASAEDVLGLAQGERK